MSQNSRSNVGGEVKSLPLRALRPDWRNPRFPPRATENFGDDDEVYVYLDKNFDAASVAESIWRHGYFNSEPLIAIPSQDGEYVVLEGNRRLTALKGLSSDDLRKRFADPRWKKLETIFGPEDTVPVLVATSRGEVAPILGYRHVTGIAPWDPFQQAKYVADLIDDEDNPLTAAEVASLIGRDVSEVRAFYRNYSTLEQARDGFELEDTERIVDEFGVWNRAMSNTGIRSYIEAPPPRDVEEGTYPLPETAAPALARLTTWIFGEPRSGEKSGESPANRHGRVITDSRELTRLSRVLAHPDGRAELEAGSDLAQAEAAMIDKNLRFGSGLESALNALRRIETDRPDELDVIHVQRLNELADIVRRLQS